MENVEITTTSLLLIYALVTTFLMSKIEHRIVKQLKLILGNDARLIGKNTLGNPIQSYTNMVFFFSYKVDHRTPEYVSKLIGKGKCLNVLYFVHLAAALMFMFHWFDSQIW